MKPLISWDRIWIERDYYNSRLRVKSRKKSYIGFTQESSMKFQVQSVYLIYIGLIVYTKLNLAYSKKYIYDMLLTYGIISEPFVLFCNIWLCDSDLWKMCDTDILHDITLTSDPKFKTKKIERKENRNKK